jgi:hypothetical protein
MLSADQSSLLSHLLALGYYRYRLNKEIAIRNEYDSKRVQDELNLRDDYFISHGNHQASVVERNYAYKLSKIE